MTLPVGDALPSPAGGIIAMWQIFAWTIGAILLLLAGFLIWACVTMNDKNGL